jgi:hypothetical protein
MFKALIASCERRALSSTTLNALKVRKSKKKEEEEEGPFNVLSVNVQHLLGRTVFSSAMLTWRCFLRPDALPDTNTRAMLHE